MPKRTNTASTSNRGPYASQACHACQKKRKRCEVTINYENELGANLKRVCERCKNSKLDCTWGDEPAKLPRSQSHVAILKQRIQALEAELASCTCRKQPHKQDSNTSQDFDLHTALFTSQPYPDWEDGYSEGSGTDEETHIEQLLVPTKHLILDDQDDLQLYGPCSIFRLAPTAPGRTPRLPEIFEDRRARYVLQVDGADETFCNPNFDWSRHLPREVFMERKEHDKLLDLLFKFFTSWCLRIVPPLFLRDMYRALNGPPSHTPPKTPHYSPMLHNALIALASAFSEDPRIRDLNSRQFFARKAKSYIEAECQKPNISVVHALSIIGSFHSSQGDQTLGYMYFGMAGRISQALGLNVDCSPWVKAGHITHDDMVDRNWAYWTLFGQDVCWSLYVGRDGCVPSPSDHQSLPFPFVDSEYDQLDWHYPASGIPPQPNYLSRTFAVTCELLRIARTIIDVVDNLSKTRFRHEFDHSHISAIDIQLSTWKEYLPDEVNITSSNRATSTPHRLMLHLAYWWLHILLHRPFYRREHSSTIDTDHIKICNRAAENIMELLTTWRTSFTLRLVPVTFVQVLFSAGTVFLLSAVQASAGLRLATQALNHSRSQAELCIKYLSEIGQSWNCAINIGSILGNLLQVVERLVGQRAEQRRKRAAMMANTQVPRHGGRPGIAIPGTSSSVPGSSSIDSGVSVSPEDFINNPLSYSPSMNEAIQFGGQQFAVDQFVDVLGSGGNFAAGGSGTAFAFSGFGGGMPGGHTLSSQPFVAVGVTDQTGAESGAFHSAYGLHQHQLHALDDSDAMIFDFWN